VSIKQQASERPERDKDARHFMQCLRPVPDPWIAAARLSRALNFHRITRVQISINGKHNRLDEHNSLAETRDSMTGRRGRPIRDTSPRYGVVIDNRYYLIPAGCAEIIMRKSFVRLIRRKSRDSARRSPSEDLGVFRMSGRKLQPLDVKYRSTEEDRVGINRAKESSVYARKGTDDAFRIE
jgi:hypothetical protein